MGRPVVEDLIDRHLKAVHHEDVGLLHQLVGPLVVPDVGVDRAALDAVRD